MQFNIEKIRHHKEKKYGSILLTFGCILWGVVALVMIIPILKGDFLHTVILLLYIAIFWFVSYITRALTKAYMFGHYVMIGPEQFPHLHQMIEEGAQKVGLTEAPQAFIYNSNGVMNAMAIRLIGRKRYIWLTSAIIDVDSDDQIRFVIGHELGHHIAGHLGGLKFFLQLPGHLIPFLGQAYSRGKELTCDRIGAYVAQNIEVSRTALQMLACGSVKLNTKMNSIAFQQQEKLVPPVAGTILHIFSHYPRITKRVEAVTLWYSSFSNNSSQN